MEQHTHKPNIVAQDIMDLHQTVIVSVLLWMCPNIVLYYKGKWCNLQCISMGSFVVNIAIAYMTHSISQNALPGVTCAGPASLVMTGVVSHSEQLYK